MFSRLLVPLDGSPLAEAALSYAEALAKQMKSELVLLRVMPPLPINPIADHAAMHTSEGDSAKEYLAEKARELEASGIRTETVVQSGSPAEQIVEFANNRPVSMIVMSTHGRSGISRWVYGSVADRVLRASCTPVLLVRSCAPGPAAI